MKKIMKIGFGASMFEKSVEDEENYIKLVKEGLEDLNLYVMEIENTYNELDNNQITADKRNQLLYRLKTLEGFVSNMNDVVKNSLVIKVNKNMFC